MDSKVDDDELEKQAIAEIMQEAKRGAERSKEMGALGWMKPQVPSTNKNFLRNTLVSTLRNPYGTGKKRAFKYKAHISPGQDKLSGPSSGVHHRKEPNHHRTYLQRDNSTQWESSLSEDESSPHRQKVVRADRDKTPEGGYIYDAYEYGHQATNDPLAKEKFQAKFRDTQEDGQSRNSDHRSTKHRHSTDRDKSTVCREREDSGSSDSIIQSFKKKKKSKKKHKHKHSKSEHRSKHKKRKK